MTSSKTPAALVESPWVTWPVELHHLPALLPGWLAGLAPSRSVIVADQIRGAIDRQTRERLVCIAVGTEKPSVHGNQPTGSGRPTTPRAESHRADRSTSESGAPTQPVESREPVAMAMLCLQPPGDSATLLHAATIAPESDRSQEELAAIRRILKQQVEAVGVQSGVDFVQWATDPATSSEWPQSFGFVSLGTLDYLARDFPAPAIDEPAIEKPAIEKPAIDGLAVDDVTDDSSEGPELTFRPIGDEGAKAESLAGLVEGTYQGSMDCPSLNQLRTARQILTGYRRVASFAPDLWWTAHDQDDRLVGCLLMGRHQAQGAPVLELVYMGILPHARGHRYGRQLARRAVRAARETGAARLLVAVDRENLPAVRVYERFGLKRLFSETVWARSFSS